MPGDVVQEAVVSLRAEIDNPGVQQFLSLLESNKIKALAAGAAVTALTKAVYNFVSSTVKQEFELEKLATKQKKSIELTRAEQTALKSMGMTLNDIKKDKALKSIYDDLVKFNKEIEMPNMRNVLANVNKLRGEFWKLKSVLEYAFQAIGAQLVTNLEAPMNRIGGKLNSISNWVRDKLPLITTRVAQVLTAFSKGVIALGEGVGKVFEFISKMPDGIRGIILALGALFGVLKTGPLGAIIAAITLIGDVIHDYENYQWNKANGLSEGQEGYVHNLNDLWGIWDIFSGEDDAREKSKTLFAKILGAMKEGLKEAIAAMKGNGSGIRSWLAEATGPVGEIFGGIIDYIKENPKEIGETVSLAFTTLAESLKIAGNAGVDIASSVAKMFAAMFGGADWESAWDESNISEFLNGENTFATGLMTALETALIRGKFDIWSVITGAISGYQQAADKAEAGDVNGNAQSIADVLQEDFNTTMSTAVELLGKGLSFAGDVAGTLMKSIIFAIIGTSESDAANTMTAALDSIGEDNAIWKGLSTGLATWIGSGNFLVGLLSGIATTFASGDEEKIKQSADEMVEAILTIWDGAWEYDASGNKTKRNGHGLHSILKSLWEGENGSGGLSSLFEGLASDIVTWLEPVGTAIKTWFDGVMDSIFASLPGWFRKLFGVENAKFTASGGIVDGAGNAYTGDVANGISKAGLEFLSYAMPYLSIGEDGKFSQSTSYGGILSYGHIPNIVEGNQINGKDVNLATLGDYVLSHGKMPTDKDGNEFTWDTVVQQYNGYNSYLGNLLKPTTDKTALQVDVSGIVQAFAAAEQGAANLAAAENEAAASMGGKDGKKAWGGRIGKEGTYTVGEDGTEYIIPITKTERAISLINQMLSEMGSSAIKRVTENFGGAGGVASAGSIQGMTMANTYNITAPVNINVNSTGADAKSVGTSIYDVAERHLLRTLRGATA